MTALLDTIARVFVAPSGEARAEPVAVTAPAAAVCGREADAVAAALALQLRSRGPVIVCAWRSTARRGSAPAVAGARRLAASLEARGLQAAPSGRLVLVSLDDDPQLAAAEAARAAAAAGDAPVVTAVCGARDPAFDDLLAAQDLALIVARDAPEELVRVGVAALGATAHHAAAVPPLSAVSAWAALAGLWVSPAARAALADARAGLS
jgi:hypothetical protein